MTMLLKLTEPQLAAYQRFIKARDKVKMVHTEANAKEPHIPKSEVIECIDVPNRNYPAFIQNDEWLEYLAASAAWWKIEPDFRKTQRMSAIRGDYGKSDNWDEPKQKVKELR